MKDVWKKKEDNKKKNIYISLRVHQYYAKYTTTTQFTLHPKHKDNDDDDDIRLGLFCLIL